MLLLFLPTTAIAHFSPSIAAVTMPPAYPAPSPQGYKPFTLTDESVSSLTILTGDELLVSGPVITASGEPKQLIFSANCGKAYLKASHTKSGRYSSGGTNVVPIG